MNPPEPNYKADTSQVNERLWQAWVCKNRELDRRGAAKRLRFLQVVLALGFVAAVVQQLVK